MISAVWHVTANPATSEQVSSGSTHSQRALILYRRRRFINHLLTYLLTYTYPQQACILSYNLVVSSH